MGQDLASWRVFKRFQKEDSETPLNMPYKSVWALGDALPQERNLS